MKKRQSDITARLLEQYPEGRCALVYEDPFELLVASRLSAQCTDVRVNIVTKDLFARWHDVKSLASASVEEIEDVIRPCGLYHVKARDLKAMSEKIVKDFDGNVPDTMEGLLSLPGVGRKIANLLLGELYGVPGVIVADTHCIRLSNRLGYVDSTDQVKVETTLRACVPPEKSLLFCHALVTHGRTVCTARSPRCEQCFLNGLCPSNTRKKEKR